MHLLTYLWVYSLLVPIFYSEAQQDISSSCFTLSSSGQITSPNYPENYGYNLDVCWVLRADPGHNVKLSFTAFDVQTRDQDCLYDYVNIFDDLEQQRKHGCSRCGDIVPADVYSSGEVLVVTFVSDDYFTRRGFSADFTSVPFSPHLIRGCNDVHVITVPELDTTIPLTTCDEPILLNIIIGILNRLKKLPDRAYERLVEWYIDAGVDLSTEEGIQSITCYIASVSSVSDLAVLFPGVDEEDVTSNYRRIAPCLQSMTMDSAWTLVSVGRRLLQWMTHTGFPRIPLRGESYLDTWQFFAEIQAGMPLRLFGDLVMFDMAFGTDATAKVNPFTRFGNSPEKWARVLHGGNSTQLNSLFWITQEHTHILDLLSHTIQGTLQEMQYVYLPCAVSGLELVEHLIQRGWLDLW